MEFVEDDGEGRQGFNLFYTKWSRSSIFDHQSGVVSACHVADLHCEQASYYEQKEPSVFPGRAAADAPDGRIKK